jgi:minor extracellular serine protease Vpr
MTTSEHVSDAYGKEFSLSDSGSGRLNIAKAFQAKIIITPPNFVINLSSDNLTSQKQLELKTIEGTLENLQVKFEGPDFIEFTHTLEGSNLLIKIKIHGQNYGDHEGKIVINHNQINYVIPVLIHYTEGSISVNQKDGKLNFAIHHPEQWSFAKISIINSKDGKIETTTVTPERDSVVRVTENGEYWIDAKIKVNEKTFDTYNTIEVNSIHENTQNLFEWMNIPVKQIIIVLGIVVVIGIVGMIKRKTVTKI